MNQAAIMKLMDSGAFDKIFKLFAGNKKETKAVATEVVVEYSKMQEDLAEVSAKLEAIIKHLKISVVKERYKVVENG